MSVLDCAGPIPGLFDSAWPAECGGPRRQKAPRSPGLDIQPGESLKATLKENGRWNVMFVQREPGQLYLLSGGMFGEQPAPGRVERVDPITLEVTAASPDLPSGGHVWCGAVLVHANGDLYVVNGSYMHRLDPDCQLVAERKLPVDRPYNGLLVMPDGNLVTKDLRISGGGSVVSVLEPEKLEVLSSLELPEPSMGRIAADFRGDDVWCYMPGREYLFRLRYKDGAVSIDEDWQPLYRDEEEGQGLAWDTTLADDNVWLHDNGDTPAVRAIHATTPVGNEIPPSNTAVDFGPQGVMRFGMADDYDRDALAPIPHNHGWVIAPPLYVPVDRILVTFDTGNGCLCALRWKGDGLYDRMWEAKIHNWMQPMVFPDTGELIVNDFGSADFKAGNDAVVVLDLMTGEEKARVATGAPLPNGMFFAPGWNRDLYYCTAGAVARVAVE
ncbi:MAG: hypothetical protein ACI8TX_002603 [Hyphomicrobiaceae bacterium]|jgi:hypothetical protein